MSSVDTVPTAKAASPVALHRDPHLSTASSTLTRHDFPHLTNEEVPREVLHVNQGTPSRNSGEGLDDPQARPLTGTVWALHLEAEAQPRPQGGPVSTSSSLPGGYRRPSGRLGRTALPAFTESEFILEVEFAGWVKEPC